MREWRWTSAWLLTHLPEPPWAAIRQAPSRGQIRPLSRLACADWVAATIACAKDTLALEEAEKKLTPTAAPKAEGGGGGGNPERPGKAAGGAPACLAGRWRQRLFGDRPLAAARQLG